MHNVVMLDEDKKLNPVGVWKLAEEGKKLHPITVHRGCELPQSGWLWYVDDVNVARSFQAANWAGNYVELVALGPVVRDWE